LAILSLLSKNILINKLINRLNGTEQYVQSRPTTRTTAILAGILKILKIVISDHRPQDCPAVVPESGQVVDTIGAGDTLVPILGNSVLSKSFRKNIYRRYKAKISEK
jgi:hypothetical protein